MEKEREAWGGRVGCGFDLGVLLEKEYTNTHNIHTHTHRRTHMRARTQMHPVEQSMRRKPAVWFFFTSLISHLVRVQPEILLLQYLKLSHQPSVSVPRWSVASCCSSALKLLNLKTPPRQIPNVRV